MNNNAHELDAVDRLGKENAWLTVADKYKRAWHMLDHTHAYTCHLGKRFIAWKVRDDGQVIVCEVYAIKDVLIESEGPRMTLEKSRGGLLDVNHRPRPFQDQTLFAWFPAFFDACFAPRDHKESDPKHRRLTWKICVRSVGDQHAALKVGRVYFSDVQEFRKLWPTAGI